MTDVAYRTDRVQDARVVPYVTTFFKSLAFLLPCKYCRQSYRQYLRELDVASYGNGRRLVEWVWRMKELVNDKLKKPLEDRLEYPLFQRRVNLCTHCAQPDDVFDFLSILGLNYDAGDRLKQKHMLSMHAVLPLVLPYNRLSTVMLKHPLEITDLQSQQHYLDWLYRLREQYVKHENLPPLPPPTELWQRYNNARAEQKQPVNCQYVLDDQSTWTAQYRQRCDRSNRSPSSLV